MQLRAPLARWIAERMNLAFRRAEKNAPVERFIQSETLKQRS
jgi:hypothetical protein